MHQAAPNLEEIFFAALEIEGRDARSAFLDQACGDPELRRRVERLLARDAQASGFLESPAAPPTVTVESPSLSEGPGTLIGPYKLREQIGEGGMGVVYVAEQTQPVRRKVALKIIKPGMDSRQVISRFEAERQALAMMDHPNIARVHDGGTTDSGRPYFVMELVKGIPITDYCDRERLSITERLELFVLVCRAVQHAHQKGIIHRDLKPSNILVMVIDGAAVPKVIDFGVAKATGASLTERTLYTAFQQFVGTPLYMSPEQADLSGVDVDTRSDIYSLGVLLYELLTGTTPFDQDTFRTAAFDELRRLIREQEPPRPSTRLNSLGATRATVSADRKADVHHLDRAVRDELDWIVMKALEKDRRCRYETANDFAADVMRYLTDQPIEARPPSTWYRFTKYARRNRAALTTAILVGLALVAGTAVSTWQAVRARQAERAAISESQRALAAETRAVQERDEALRQRQRADARFHMAYQAVSRLRVAFLRMRLAAGPERSSRVRRVIADDCLRFYQQLVENNEDDPGIAFEVAESYHFMRSLYRPADKKRGHRAFLKALSLYERLAQERPEDTKVLGSLANLLDFLGDHYHREKQLDRAEGAFRRSLDLFEQIARTHPDYVDDWYLICNLTDWGYGRLLRNQGRTAESEALNHRILAWFERPEFDLNWFETMGGTRAKGEGYDGFIALSNLLVRCGQLLKAIPVLERARPHLVFDVDYEYYLDALTNLSLKLAADPDPEVRARAAELAREGVELTSRTDARAWLMLGLVLDRTGDRRGADEALKRAGEQGGDTATVLNNVTWQFVSDPLARDMAPHRAVQMAERVVELDPKAAYAWNTLGVARYRAGEWKGAIKALEKSEALEPDKHLAFDGFFLAMAHWRLGQKGEARTWYDKAVAWMEKNQPEDVELIRFRAEAATLLGLTDMPADVFSRP